MEIYQRRDDAYWKEVYQYELIKNNKQSALFILCIRLGNYSEYIVKSRISKVFWGGIAQILNVLVINLMFNSYVPKKTQIDIGMDIGHPYGIIINENSRVGRNLRITHQVTIGQSTSGVPIIGDNVLIGPGAKIIGGIHIASNTRIGANAVVTNDIQEENGLYIGIPAYKKAR